MPKLIYQTLWLSWCFPMAAILIGLALWNRLPDSNVSDIILMPVASVVVGILLFSIAHFRQNTFQDKKQIRVLAKICTSAAFLFFGIQMGLLLTRLNPDNFSINEVVFLSVGVFLILFGLSTKDIAPNYYIGFTFPWNRNAPRIWSRTHDLFYRWFVLVGGLFLVTTLFYPSPEVSAVLIAVAVIMPSFLSYRFSVKERRNLAHRQKL